MGLNTVFIPNFEINFAVSLSYCIFEYQKNKMEQIKNKLEKFSTGSHIIRDRQLLRMSDRERRSMVNE